MNLFIRMRTDARPTMLAIALLGFASPAAAQMTCGDALAQLQRYVANVNQAANFEINGGIAMKCQGNPICGQNLFQQLNFWYAQQTQLVNNYYAEVAQNCSSQPQRQLRRRGGRDLSMIDEDDVQDLQVDNEDRSVRIRIPETPRGFAPR